MAPVAPDPSCVLRTLHALRDEEFDVLHLHEPLSPGPTLTSLVMGSVPLVGTFHAAGSSAAYRWLRPLARWLAHRLAVRCAVSEDARVLAAASIGGQYEMVHNGIEVERFAKAEPWPTTAPTILFVSRHESRKGLEVLLASLEFIAGDFRLWVASDGPETPRLRAATTRDARVEWIGRIGDDEKARRLSGADVVCAPSLYGESFGMVLLESMAASTPIVASDLPGYRKMSDDGQAALLVPPGDARALGGALSRVLHDASVAATLVASGEARASQFSMDRLAERYLGIYGQAVDRTARQHRRS